MQPHEQGHGGFDAACPKLCTVECVIEKDKIGLFRGIIFKQVLAPAVLKGATTEVSTYLTFFSQVMTVLDPLSMSSAQMGLIKEVQD